AIFRLTASFHSPEEGNGLISPDAPTGLVAPESLPTFADCIAEVGPIYGDEWSLGERPTEYRIAHAPWAPTGPSERGGIDYWFKTPRPVNDEAALHEGVMAYMSDDCLADVVLVPYGRTWGSEGTMMVSLDHSMWFHQPARVDEWIYVEQWPDVATGARGLAHSRMWQDGKLVVSCAQEALVRF
ncbi:MAG: thioesterase family protein, partial [Actinomycetota bacterium]|nr:thioesterase family protein [Actinomycetota bacterium]